MKRFVWLLIAAVCTALAQVQPVVMASVQEAACCCTGEAAGACGMPDCAPTPTATPCGQSVPAAATQRVESRRVTPAPKARSEALYVRVDSRSAKSPTAGVSLRGTPPASVPLFKAHCSFLI